MNRIISTQDAPSAVGPYSQAIINGSLVYTSGQLPIDPENGNCVGDDIVTQTEQVLRNLEGILNASGSSLDKIIKTTCFITNMEDFQDFNGVYERFIKKNPARSCVAVRELPKGVRIEIEAIGYV